MQKSIFTFIILLSLTFSANAQQISLYDSEGEAVAYIDFDKQATIFMWDGTPAAFIEEDNRNLCVIGFNGNFLGWYEDGIIYDKNGYAVGARKEVISMMTKMEGMKSMQKMIPMRPIKPIAPIKPIQRSSWSSTSLMEFLYLGKK